MPRCPDTCPKVIEQKRRLAELQASGREVEEGVVTFAEFKIPSCSSHPDAETQCSQSSIGGSSVSRASSRSATGRPRSAAASRSAQGRPTRGPTRSKSDTRISRKSCATSCSSKKSKCDLNKGDKKGKDKVKEKKQEKCEPMPSATNGKGDNGGFWENLCTCSLRCILNQIANDKFIMANITSLMFFAVGVKLCLELDNWTLPNSFF